MAVKVADWPALTVARPGVMLVVVARSEDCKTVSVEPDDTALAA